MITSVLIGTFANSVDVDPLTNLIFVTDAQENILAVVDGRTNTVTGTATEAVGCCGQPPALSNSPEPTLSLLGMLGNSSARICLYLYFPPLFCPLSR